MAWAPCCLSRAVRLPARSEFWIFWLGWEFGDSSLFFEGVDPDESNCLPKCPWCLPSSCAMDRPPQHELAKALEAQPIIRQRLLSEETPYLTRWASQTAIGVRSVAAMRLNAVALEKLAEWWCPCNPSPKAVSISLLRQEAGNLDGGVIMELEPNHVQTNHRLCLFHFKIHSCQNQAP